MNCPICNVSVLNNSDYSVHMNVSHRGKTYKSLDYKDLNKAKGQNNHESKNKANVRPNVD
jgi:uncharacterized C2H2 Zn-finger protein